MSDSESYEIEMKCISPRFDLLPVKSDDRQSRKKFSCIRMHVFYSEKCINLWYC